TRRSSDLIGERHALGVAQLGIGLGAAFLVATDRGGLVALGKGRQDRLLDGRPKLESSLANRLAECALELRPVLEERVRQAAQEGADGLLKFPSLGALLLTGGALLSRLGEILKSLLVIESCDSLGRRLEIQPQRSLDRDLAEAEVRGREDTAHDHLFFLPVLHDPARVTVPEVGENFQDVPRALRRNLAALVAEALAHRYPQAARAAELASALAPPCRALRLTPTSPSFPSFLTRRVSPSRKASRLFRLSRARSGGISRRLSPRLLRIGTQKPLASMSWTLPLRALALRFVTTHT